MAVVAILGKRRTDLTDDDIEVMREVVEIVEEETEDRSTDELVGDERRRYRLLNVGHDPVRGG